MAGRTSESSAVPKIKGGILLIDFEKMFIIILPGDERMKYLFIYAESL
jgi:hypothetical protein